MDPWRATEEFGRTLGLSDLNLESGYAEVVLEAGVRLGLLLCGRDVLVHVVHPAPHPDDMLTLRLLQGAEARDLPGFALQVGSRGSGADFCVIGSVRIPETLMSPDAIAHACEQLLKWADNACCPR